MPGTLTIDAGAGVNTVNLGSAALGFLPNVQTGGDTITGSGGLVGGIAGLLVMNGSGSDTLNIDDSADGASTATLTGSHLSGWA